MCKYGSKKTEGEKDEKTGKSQDLIQSGASFHPRISEADAKERMESNNGGVRQAKWNHCVKGRLGCKIPHLRFPNRQQSRGITREHPKQHEQLETLG